MHEEQKQTAILEYLNTHDATYEEIREGNPTLYDDELNAGIRALKAKGFVEQIGSFRGDPIFSITDEGRQWLESEAM